MVMKKLEKVRPFFNIYKHSNVLFVYILLKKIVIKKKINNRWSVPTQQICNHTYTNTPKIEKRK
jgi:hypothetical protein